MSAAESIIGKSVRWVTNYEPELSGQVFSVEEVLVTPGKDADLEALPLLKIKGKDGNVHTACPEELRTVDGTLGVTNGAEATYVIGGKPVMDIHPGVEALAIEFFEKHKDFYAA